MTVQENRFALIAQSAEQLPYLRPPDRIEPIGRLVQDQQVGVMQQRLRQAEPLIHPFAEPFDRFVVAPGQSDKFQQFVTPAGDVGRRHPAETPIQAERRAGRVMLVDPEVFGQVADPLPRPS